jgi:indoleacetamide hydrolase
MSTPLFNAARPASDRNLLELTATAAVGAMRKGDIKAEAYAHALLDRADELQGLNAFIKLDPAAVLDAARAADKRRSAGEKLGRLHGLPVPIKDSVNTKELPTTNGTRALREFRPMTNAGVLAPLLAEGAIVMGKTNLHELSWGWTSNNATFGAVHNPYDQARIPGGSSGGSAAAIAARIAPLAVGEDTFGSIRVPASCCGIAGLRPTFGRYPNDGIMPITNGKFDQVGSLARSVCDLALFDSVVTGDFVPMTAKPLKGLRLGLCPDLFQASLDSEVERVTRKAFQKLRDAGVTLVETKAPDIFKAASDIAFTIILYETVPAFAQFLAEQQTGLSFEQMLAQMGEGLRSAMKSLAVSPNRPSADDYEAMLAKREQLEEALRQHFEETDIAALAFPTIMCRPPRIGEEVETDIGCRKVPLSTALVRNIALGNCAGLASLVLPAGLASDGLPVGLEFDALPGQDRGLLALGLSLEDVLSYTHKPKL